MSEGYEKERRAPIISDGVKAVSLIAFVILASAFIGGLIGHYGSIEKIVDLQWRLDISLRNYDGLKAQHEKLRAELDFWTCRVQLPPEPMPEPVETPTLIEHPTIEEEIDAARALSKTTMAP